MGLTIALQRTILAGELAKLEASERVAILEDAVEQADETTFLAFLGAPRWMNLVDPNLLAVARGRWEHRQHPEVADQVKTVGELLGQLESTLENARGVVTDRLPEPDPVVELS